MSVIVIQSQEFRDFSQKGILSADPVVNPLAHNWNRVMAPRRIGSSHKLKQKQKASLSALITHGSMKQW